jgi:hypothetical protein
MFVGVRGLENYLLVRLKPDPCKAFQDRTRRFFRRPGEISVLDPQKELPALLPGVKVIK